MNRKEAAVAGSKFFDSRNPCVRDGTTQRYTINGVCCACAKARSRREHAHYRGLLAAANPSPEVPTSKVRPPRTHPSEP